MSPISRKMKLKKLLCVLKIAHKISSGDFFPSSKLSYISRYVILSFLVVTFPCITVYRLLKETFRTRGGTIVKGAQFLSYISRVPTFVICLLACSYHRKTSKKLFEDVEKLDERFAMLGNEIDYGKLLQFSYFQTLGIFFKIIFQNISYIDFPSGGNHPILDWVIYSIPIFLIFMLNLQWFILQRLQQMWIVSVRKFAKTSDINRFWLASETAQKYQETSEIRKTKFFGELSKILDIIYDQNEKMMKSFGVQVMCILILIFISTTYTSFKLINIIAGKDVFEMRTVVYHILYCLIFSDIMIPCMRLQNDIKILAEYISYLSVKYSGTSQDKEVRNLLLQVQYQKIQCSILGSFVLDGTFLTGCLSSEITNLIILVQSEN